MAESTLPIAAAHREFTVKVGGQAVSRTHPLIAVSVVNRANHIASARLVYADGAAATGDFALASSALFAPGAAVEVHAGSADSPTLLFSGLVVRIGIQVREHVSPQLVVDCRHAASKLAVARRGANYFDLSDSDVISQMLSDGGIDADVEGTQVKHPQLVQCDVIDWDFIVARAQANGLIVLTRGAKLVVRQPSLSGYSVATLRFGATLLDFDAQADARIHPKSVHALSWNAGDQALQDVEAKAPDFATTGNFDPDQLAAGAGAERFNLRHGALAQEEAQALADAHWLRARVDQTSGRAKCIGLPQVQPGDVVELAGVGERFKGKVLVTGVSHELDTLQGFRTHVQFGSVTPDPALLRRLASPARVALLASASGLQCGVVTSLQDPASEARVRVRLPLVDAGDDGVWARIASLDAGSQRGFQFRPEIGDEVVVGFLDEDPRQPVVLGMLHSSAHPAPLPASDDNHQKGYVSRSGMRVHFDDEKTVLTLSTPGGRTIALDDQAGELKLQDGNGNKLVFDKSGITIESAASLLLKAGSDGRVETGTSFNLAAGTELKLEGSASAELKGAATTKLVGGIVQIN